VRLILREIIKLFRGKFAERLLDRVLSTEPFVQVSELAALGAEGEEGIMFERFLRGGHGRAAIGAAQAGKSAAMVLVRIVIIRVHVIIIPDRASARKEAGDLTEKVLGAGMGCCCRCNSV